MEPIFIISLPRSGSTLLQRILSTSDEVSTVSEPWLALPVAYMLKNGGVSSEYGIEWASIAYDEYFSSDFEKAEFYKFSGNYIKKLYSLKCSNNSVYFLDKTPRYHLILKELVKMFPNAKFVVLVRNPLEVLASSINTWGKRGKWNAHTLKIDLMQGVRNIYEFSFIVRKENYLKISYEQLTSDTDKCIYDLEKFLKIELNKHSIDNISTVQIKGLLGDPSGVKKFDKVQTKGRFEYVNQLNGVLRKIWVRKYIRSIDRKVLEYFEVDSEEVLMVINNASTSFNNMFSDLARMIYGVMYTYIDIFHFVNIYKNRKIKDKVSFR